MKIGIFDSGLGGLLISKAIISKLPKYDYTYFGDTKHMPYGKLSQAEILKYTKQALIFLFENNCKLVIIACNTSSAKALRKIQREFLPKFYPNKKVLGVIVPTLEKISNSSSKIGVLATSSTVNSHAYKRELKKINPKIEVIEQSAPELATLIEKGEIGKAKNELKKYLNKLTNKKISTLVLGCTHYCLLKNEIKATLGNKIKVISQDNIIPEKLKEYLKKHTEIEKNLTKNSKYEFAITKYNKSYKKIGKNLFGRKINFKLVNN